MHENTRYLIAGDQGITIEFGNSISEDINQKVRSMMLAIEGHQIEGIVEMIPSYRSLLVEYDALIVGYEALCNQLRSLEAKLGELSLPEPVIVEIPTLYGGEAGPDLETVALHNGLTQEQVIQIHSSKDYLVYMLGFTPGFPYLGGMDETISTPRLQSPRARIPGGSVGIAGSQTGVYPVDSPGGWQLIGRTPLKLYNAEQTTPILLSAGNYVRFVPVDEEIYSQLEKAVSAGGYTLQTHTWQR